MAVMATSYPTLERARGRIRARCFRTLGFVSAALLHKSRPSCEILQDHAAEPLGDGLYGGFITPGEAADAGTLPERNWLSSPPCGQPGSVPLAVFVSFCATAVVILFGTFLLPGTGSYPRG